MHHVEIQYDAMSYFLQCYRVACGYPHQLIHSSLLVNKSAFTTLCPRSQELFDRMLLCVGRVCGTLSATCTVTTTILLAQSFIHLSAQKVNPFFHDTRHRPFRKRSDNREKTPAESAGNPGRAGDTSTKLPLPVANLRSRSSSKHEARRPGTECAYGLIRILATF